MTRIHAAVALALALATWAVYAQVPGFEFVNYDDPRYITQNAPVSRGLTRESVEWAFTTDHMVNWHPVTWLSHMLDVELYGLEPGGHHVSNLLLHIANALLLFWLLASMTRHLWPSAFVAACFALHPLHVESVAWVAERKDVLSTAFGLLSMAAYVRFARTGSHLAYLACALLLALGLMAKPMLVTFPLLFLLLDYWPLERAFTRGQLVEKLPLLALSLVFSFVTLSVQGRALEDGASLSLLERTANALVAYATYLWKTVWPTHLAVLYPHPQIHGESWSATRVGLSAAVLALITLGVVLARKRRYLVVGWLWFVGTLVPVIGIVQAGVQALADRYTYVPIIGLFIAVAWGVRDLAAASLKRGALTRAVCVAAVTTLLVLGVVARAQVAHWRNGLALFRHTVEVTGPNPIARNNLANAIFATGDLEGSLEHYRAAVAIKPDYLTAHNNLAKALIKLQRPAEAIPSFRSILQHDPDSASARQMLGNLLRLTGDLDAAIEQYSLSLERHPESPVMLRNLVGALLSRGRFAEALGFAERLVAAHPDSAVHQRLYGQSLGAVGRFEDAIAPLRRAVELDPASAENRRELATVERAAGQQVAPPPGSQDAIPGS